MTIVSASISNFINLAGMLDFVPDGIPEFAFSLRLLTGTYGSSNPCITVRRSSDNATMNIGFVNGALDITTLLNFVGE